MTLTKDAKIYVAGHTGLLGSSVVRNLRAHGHDNLLLSTRQEVNLTDDVAVGALFRREKPDLVVLTAAKVVGIQANIADPVGFLVRESEDQQQCDLLGAGSRRAAFGLYRQLVHVSQGF